MQLKKLLKWVGRAVAAPVVAVAMAAGALYLPPVQNYVKDKVADYLSVSPVQEKLHQHMYLIIRNYIMGGAEDTTPGDTTSTEIINNFVGNVPQTDPYTIAAIGGSSPAKANASDSRQYGFSSLPEGIP